MQPFNNVFVNTPAKHHQMKSIITIVCLLSSCMIYGQELSFEQYQKEAKINKRLLPKYGLITKSSDEQVSDKAFIDRAIKEHSTAEKASSKMVEKGYHSLESDPRTAMYNFNQAYLLDSSNANIYWGYGKLYTHFKQFKLAKMYYEQGLKLDSKNTMLLNGLAENYHSDYEINGIDSNMTNCIAILQSSFRVNPSKSQTSKLLTLAYIETNNCEKARTYYKVYLATDGKESEFELMEIMEKKCGSTQ